MRLPLPLPPGILQSARLARPTQRVLHRASQTRSVHAVQPPGAKSIDSGGGAMRNNKFTSCIQTVASALPSCNLTWSPTLPDRVRGRKPTCNLSPARRRRIHHATSWKTPSSEGQRTRTWIQLGTRQSMAPRRKGGNTGAQTPCKTTAGAHARRAGRRKGA